MDIYEVRVVRRGHMTVAPAKTAREALEAYRVQCDFVGSDGHVSVDHTAEVPGGRVSVTLTVEDLEAAAY